MKIKYIWAFVATFATALGFTSCKDEYEKIIWDSSRMGSEAKIEGRAQNLSALQGSTIYTNSITINAKGSDAYGEHFWYSDVQSATTKLELKYGIVGKGDTVCINATEHTIALEPFEEYFIQSISYGVDKDGNRCFEGDTTNVTFYNLPPVTMTLSHHYGAGKSNGVYLNWEINGNGEYKAEVNKALEAKYEQIEYTIEITSDEVECNVEPLKLVECNDIVIFPDEVGIDSTITQKFVSIGDKKVHLYNEAYKYNFKVTAQLPVGDRIAVLGESTAKSIFVNTNNYAVDDELNIYRTMKFGTDIWTIDNFRGKLSTWASQVRVHNDSYFYQWNSYGGSDHVGNEISSKVQGYHVSTDNDWKRLEQNWGMTYNTNFFREDVHVYSDNLISVLTCDDNTTYEEYFANSAPWESIVAPTYEEEELRGISSFNAQLIGFYFGSLGSNYPTFEHEGDATIFMVCSYSTDQYYRVISEKYKNICKYNDCFNVYCSVRLVKD